MPDRPTPPAYGDLPAAAADRVLARPSSMSRTRLLSLDGPAGSGKTTLAHLVADRFRSLALRAEVLSLDDLYDGWSGLDAALERRVHEQVLEPLSVGRTARWQAYDWAAGAFGTWHDLAPADVLVLEGCGAGARLFAPYTTLLVWVEAEADVRARRAVVRDGAGVLDHWAGWATLEERTFARNATASRADLVVRT